MPADTTYHDLLNEEDYQFVDSTLRHKMDVPLHRMYLKPGHLTMLLGKIDEITKLKKAGYSESQIDSIHSQVMDAVLEKKAKEKGYIINGLETISEQFEMIMPGDLKENATACAEYCRKEKEKDKEYTQFQTLTDALVEVYRSQSMKRLIEYEIQMDAFYLNASPYLQEIAIHQRKVLLKDPEHELDNQTHRTHKRQNDLYCRRSAASAGREWANHPSAKGRIQSGAY